MTLDYDIIVIGGGHAGCEAGSAAARLGSRTLLLTMDMAKLAAMSCNPAVGGVAKGQIVREIDALGGQMGRITDLTTIQFRMLNRSKGAAMWSPRAQCDKTRFSEEWRRTLENTWNLYIWQDAATELLFAPAPETNAAPSDNLPDETTTSFNSAPGTISSAAESDADSDPTLRNAPSAAGKLAIRGVRTRMGIEFSCRKVILTSGTFLGGVMHCGASHAEGGRAGDAASHGITESLRAIGFETGRMKTGTPARLDARTIDFEILEPQYGDENPAKFSFSPETQPVKEQLPCFLVYTSKEVHDILRTGFDRSPLFNGTICGIGPRYCPSIEDKLRTFADKDQHQLFLEPEGSSTNEYYLNGFSSSLPWEVQWKALHKIRGFEDLHIFRPGYAIEYDYFPPTQLHHSLETKLVSGLYFAGQVNGTTGYEEAAAQGLIAGINAHRAMKGESPVVLKRDEAYIGVLIDDLVTKGVDEPYRMFTSRAEYRILLRQDDADMRLTEKSYQMGLAKQDRYDLLREKKESRDAIIRFVETYSVKPQYINSGLEKLGTAPLSHGCKLFDVVLRPQTTLENLADLVPALRAELDKVPASRKEEIIEAAEILIKYSGYIKREQIIADKINRLENIRIKGKFDYNSIQSLSTEARQKLTRIDPDTIAQASRIPGISPSDINILLVLLGR